MKFTHHYVNATFYRIWHSRTDVDQSRNVTIICCIQPTACERQRKFDLDYRFVEEINDSKQMFELYTSNVEISLREPVFRLATAPRHLTALVDVVEAGVAWIGELSRTTTDYKFIWIQEHFHFWSSRFPLSWYLKAHWNKAANDADDKECWQEWSKFKMFVSNGRKSNWKHA